MLHKSGATREIQALAALASADSADFEDSPIRSAGRSFHSSSFDLDSASDYSDHLDHSNHVGVRPSSSRSGSDRRRAHSGGRAAANFKIRSFTRQAHQRHNGSSTAMVRLFRVVPLVTY